MKLTTLKIVLLGLLICFYMTSAYATNLRDAAIDALVFSPKPDGSEKDGMAKVYELQGKAVITPKGSPEERNLKVGDEINKGDSVFTEKGAKISISFDNQKKNAIQIPEDSRAIFTSIEPTDIKLENGSIFSVVNGLAQGSTWKVTTPSAVAAVRGTVFLVRYEAANGKMYAATVNVPGDGKTSAIEIQSLNGGATTEISEGKEISMKAGEAPSSEMVQDLSPEAVSEVQNFFEQVSSESEALEKSDDNESKSEAESDNSGENPQDKSLEDTNNFDNPADAGGSDMEPPPINQDDTLKELEEPKAPEEEECRPDGYGGCL